MRRFIAAPEQIDGKHIYLTDKEDLHHLRKVLRLSIGDTLDISDGTAWEYRAEIISLTEKEACLTILDKQKFAREPNLLVTLYQGIPKAAKMEGIIQKTVELGVHQIVPVFMERTVVVDKGNFEKKLVRWQKISDEAVKQCKRGYIPKISSAIYFPQMIADLKEYELVLFPYENEEKETIKDCLRKITESGECPKQVAIIIGPEGGFSEKEAAVLCEKEAVSVSLGKTILRTETAGPAALAMTMYDLEL